MSAVAGRVQSTPSGDSEIQEYRERLRVFIVGPRLGIGAAFSFSVHYHYAGNQDLAAGVPMRKTSWIIPNRSLDFGQDARKPHFPNRKQARRA